MKEEAKKLLPTKPAGKKEKDKKKKMGTDALAAAFAALEVQPEGELPAEATAGTPPPEVDGTSEAAPAQGKPYKALPE